MLRIDGEMHTALVRVIRHDPARNRVVTVSLDKTIRVWQLPDWRLTRVIRVPSEPGNEGKLNALAIPPDGRTIAAAGWTGWEWDRSGTVYLFDADTGALVRRISGLKTTVSYMAYSPDGSRLAVGLQGKGGLHVFETRNYKQIAEDLEYGERLAYVEFSPRDNTLVTTADDGYIRIYDSNQKLIGRQSVKVSTQLGGIRISPDGTKAAFGFQDIPTVVIISIPEMRVLSTPTAKDVAGQSALCCIAWSKDGRYLYANGYYTGVGDTPIYRWSTQDFTTREVIVAAKQRIESMYPLDDGSLLYVTEDPSFGVIDKQGKRTRFIESVIGDFRDGETVFRVSPDAMSVQFPMARGGGAIGAFSLADLKYSSKGPPDDLLPLQVRSSKKLKLDHWHNLANPMLNGTPLPTHAQEVVRSYAISRDEASLLLGTEWSLRLYDTSGKVLWDKPAPGVAWNVAIADQGRFALASFGDGSIRWFRLSDGQEMLALFPHRNGADWVLWRPDGYYASSENGDNFVGWQVNRGKDQVPDFYRAVQFERVFYRPDLIRDVLKPNGQTRNLSASHAFSIDRLMEIAPPRIAVSEVRSTARQGDGRLAELDIEVQSVSPPVLREFAVYVNGIPVTPTAQRDLAQGEQEHFRRRIKVALGSSDNDIRVEVWNGVSLGLAETYLRGSQTLVPAAAGDLYVLAIGANRFTDLPADRDADLLYAGRDAEMVVKTLREGGAGLFRNVYTKLLNDRQETKPTKQEIIESLSFITQAGPEDTVVVFLASHGFSDAAGNYYFLPRDAKVADLDNVLLGKDSTGKASSLVSWQEFFEVIRRTAGRRLLIVDTCEAKNMAGTFDAHSLKKRSAASLFALLVAAQGNEKSQEYPNKRHGLFTYALLEGLKGEADKDHDQRISLEEAFAFAVPMVEQLRNKQEGLQTPDLLAPPILRTVPLTAVRP